MARDGETASQGGVTMGTAAARAFKVPTNKDELIAWLESKREQGRPLMPQNQMKLNMAFFLGFQWVTWDHRMRAYRRPTVDIQDPNTPVRISANKVTTFGERTIAKLTKDVPEAECRPVSDDENDRDSARVGTRILDHELDRLHWKTRLQSFLQWPVVIGWGYMHTWWNPDAGDKLADDEDGAVFDGDICMDIVPPFELHVDPSAMTMAEARWCVRTTTLTREAAWEKWDVELAGGTANSLAHEVQQLGSTGMTDVAHPAEEWVNVYQLWMKPCKAAPKGLVVTWANQEIIEKKAFPYDHGELPFVQCDLLPGLGAREGRTWFTDLLPLQTDYNDTLSREATIRRQITPKFIGAVGQIDPQRITSRVETLLYMPGITANPPKFEMPNSTWAQQFEMGMARDEADMADRAGLNEASQGKAPGSSAAASILANQEADDTKMLLSATCLALFIQDVGRQILLLAKQYWDEKRTVRVWSDDNMLAAYRYAGADVDERLDVHVTTESALPKSKAARAQLVFELQKIFPQLMDPQTTMNMLNVPGTDLITAQLDADTRVQLREIGQLLEGGEPEVKGWHDHQVHLKVLNAFRNTNDYEKLDPTDQARFDAHAAIHEMLVLRKMGISVPTPSDPVAAAQADAASRGLAGVQGPAQPPPAPGAPAAPASQPAQPSLAQTAGIGQGAGHPGYVPGTPVDSQAASMGQ